MNEARLIEARRLMDLYILIQETPDGACNRLSLESRTIIKRDVELAFTGAFGFTFNIQAGVPGDSWGQLAQAMIDMGLLPLTDYLKGVM